MERRLFGQVTVGHQPRQQVDQEVERATMPHVLNLTDVLELVVDTLDDRPLAQQQLVHQAEQPPAHGLAGFGDEVYAVMHQQVLRERLGDIALVAEEFAKEPSYQARHGPTVVHVARRETNGEQLAPVIDDQMQLEPIEPAQGCFAASRIGAKDAMGVDAWCAADAQTGGIHEADARTGAELCVHIERQRQQDARQQIDEAGIADQLGNSARNWVWTCCV
jgi:hypothetical protein